MRFRDSIRRPRSLVSALVVSALALGALLAWAVASPVGASPDDDYHLASIWCGLGEREGICEPTGEPGERAVPARAVTASECFAFKPEAAASCPLPSDDVLEVTDRGNFADGGYPPVFYWVMSLFVIPGEVGVSVLLMRAFNAALAVGLIALVVRLLPEKRRGGLVFAVIATAVPLGVFIVPSVNPSSWAVLSAAVTLPAIAAFFEAETPRRAVPLAALSLVGAGIGAGARADAAVYNGLFVVLALILAARKPALLSWKMLVPALIAVMSLTSFLTSGQSSGAVTPAGESGEIDPANFRRLFLYNVLRLPELWSGSLGTWGLGWLDTAMPASVWVPTLVTLGGLLLIGMGAASPRKWAAVGVAVTALVIVPLYILMRSQVLIGSYVQPRYVFPLVIVAMSVALWQVGRRPLVPTAPQRVLIIVMLAVAFSVALYTNLRRYVTGVDVLRFSLDSGVEWWWGGPITPMVVWIAGSILCALALTAALFATRTTRDRTGPSAPTLTSAA